MPPLNNRILKLKRKVKNLRREAGWKFGLSNNNLSNARGSRILVYHGICLRDPFQFNTLFLSLKNFEKQLQLFKKHFNIISLNDLYEGNLSIEKFNICLSFDDGFANNYKYVLPLLEKYEIPATFFITGIQEAGYDFLWNDLLSIAGRLGPSKINFLGEDFIKRNSKYLSVSSKQSLNDLLRCKTFEAKKDLIKILSDSMPFKKLVNEDYWLQMNKEEIKKLAFGKWTTIGSHSYYHNDLAQLPIENLAKDLRDSKSYLENITGKEVKALSFPYGSYSRQVVEEAKHCGYTQLLATEFLFEEEDRNDKALKERLTTNPFISPVNQLHAIINGHYN